MKTTGGEVAGVTRYAPMDSVTALHFPAIVAEGSAGEAIWQHGRPTVTEVWRLLMAKNGHDLAQLNHHSLARGANPIAAVDTVLPMVNRLWEPIAKLGLAMRNGPVRHRDVLDVLGIPSEADQHRYTAAIRAGAEPGKLTVSRLSF